MTKKQPLVEIVGGKKNTFIDTTAHVGENQSFVKLKDTEDNTFSRTLIKRYSKKKWFLPLIITVAGTVIGGGILFYLRWV